MKENWNESMVTWVSGVRGRRRCQSAAVLGRGWALDGDQSYENHTYVRRTYCEGLLRNG